MWLNIQRFHFVSADSAATRGKLDSRTFKLIQMAVDLLMERVKQYKDSLEYLKQPNIFESFVLSLDHCLVRLKFLSMTFHQAIFLVTELQRYYHEITALLDYMLIYKPRMDGSVIAATTVERTLGAFTDNARMVQDLYRG